MWHVDCSLSGSLIDQNDEEETGQLIIIDIALVLVGIALLIAGGHGVVTGATRLAESIGVSEIAIGMTVVAFGTSAPELAVNWMAAAQGSTAVAFGNIIGSNLANIAFVLGVAALVRPLHVESEIVSREMPIMALATVAAWVLGMDRIRGAQENYDRGDGLMLLLLFLVFLYITVSEVVGTRREDPLVGSATAHAPTGSDSSTWRAALMALVGLAGLLCGADLTVDRAVSLAERLDVPRDLIGLTIVAFGTSLPEFTTSVVAAFRGQPNLAVANVVGSNIFNLLLILGSTSVIRDVEVPANGGATDLTVLVIVTVALFPLARTAGSNIVRWHGALLVGGYLGYLAWRVAL